MCVERDNFWREDGQIIGGGMGVKYWGDVWAIIGGDGGQILGGGGGDVSPHPPGFAALSANVTNLNVS